MIKISHRMLILRVCDDEWTQSNHMKKGVQSVITKVKARQILDSRGIPTVEVDLYTNKAMFRASVPSGNSSGM